MAGRAERLPDQTDGDAIYRHYLRVFTFPPPRLTEPTGRWSIPTTTAHCGAGDGGPPDC